MSGLNREQDDGRPKPSASTSSAATSSAAMSGAVMSALERSGGMELPTNVPFGGMAAGHLSPELVEQVSKESAALLGVAAHHHAAALAGRRDSVMMGIPDDENEDSDDDVPSGSKRAGRRKICIKYIEDKSRRHITFSKRKAGIMKKVRWYPHSLTKF